MSNFALVYWIIDRTKMVVKNTDVPAGTLVGDVVKVLCGRKKYDAKILAYSDDKKYLDALVVSADGTLLGPKKKSNTNMVGKGKMGNKAMAQPNTVVKDREEKILRMKSDMREVIQNEQNAASEIDKTKAVLSETFDALLEPDSTSGNNPTKNKGYDNSSETSIAQMPQQMKNDSTQRDEIVVDKTRCTGRSLRTSHAPRCGSHTPTRDQRENNYRRRSRYSRQTKKDSANHQQIEASLESSEVSRNGKVSEPAILSGHTIKTSRDSDNLNYKSGSVMPRQGQNHSTLCNDIIVGKTWFDGNGSPKERRGSQREMSNKREIQKANNKSYLRNSPSSLNRNDSRTDSPMSQHDMSNPVNDYSSLAAEDFSYPQHQFPRKFDACKRRLLNDDQQGNSSASGSESDSHRRRKSLSTITDKRRRLRSLSPESHHETPLRKRGYDVDSDASSYSDFNSSELREKRNSGKGSTRKRTEESVFESELKPMLAQILRKLNENKNRLDAHEKLIREPAHPSTAPSSNRATYSTPSTSSSEKNRVKLESAQKQGENHNSHHKQREQRLAEVEIRPGSGVYVDRTSLKCMKRWKIAPREMVRRLMLYLVGRAQLKSMSARGKTHNSIPEDIFDAVFYYVNEQCPAKLTESEYVRVLNLQCGNLRNPKLSKDGADGTVEAE